MSRNTNSEELETLRNHGMISSGEDFDGEDEIEAEENEHRHFRLPSQRSQRDFSRSFREMGCQADYE